MVCFLRKFIRRQKIKWTAFLIWSIASFNVLDSANQPFFRSIKYEIWNVIHGGLSTIHSGEAKKERKWKKNIPLEKVWVVDNKINCCLFPFFIRSQLDRDVKYVDRCLFFPLSPSIYLFCYSPFLYAPVIPFLFVHPLVPTTSSIWLAAHLLHFPSVPRTRSQLPHITAASRRRCCHATQNFFGFISFWFN